MAGMTTQESYWGKTIEVETKQLPDASWMATARIGAEAGADAAEPLHATGATEADARQAALALAKGQVDQGRTHSGKP